MRPTPNCASKVSCPNQAFPATSNPNLRNLNFKIFTFITTSILIIKFICLPLYAFRLPNCAISEEERTLRAEDILESYNNELGGFSQNVSFKRLDDYEKNPKIRLNRKERDAAKRYYELNIKLNFWKNVVDLKQALLNTHKQAVSANTKKEADSISKIIIETLYFLSQKWRVGSFAHLQNFFVNVGLKEKGHCYHYADALRKALSIQPWSFFDIHWGAAREGTNREHNCIVITAKGSPFGEGLVIDGWRKAGRPFWISLKDDHYPWVETDGVFAD